MNPPAPYSSPIEAGPPPRYASVMKKVYPYSLRPIVIFTAIIGLIWGLVMATQLLQDRGSPNTSGKQSTFNLILVIMFFVIAGLELVVGVIAIMNKVSLGRLLKIIAPLGVVITLAVQVMNVVLHWTLKSDLINQCVQNTVGGTYRNDLGTVVTISNDQATNACNSAWNKGSWSVIAWLLVSVILAALFASLALSYYRQLLDPTSVRQRRAQVESFALQPQYYNQYANNPPPPPHAQGQGQGQGQQAWMVPPYPGPPANMPPQGGYEKSDYHPSAEWANRDESGNSNERAQDEAWSRAQASGPTAHLTSPGGTRRSREVEQGYPIRNQEEDEAWDRARDEGVTAHLTGSAAGAPKK